MLNLASHLPSARLRMVPPPFAFRFVSCCLPRYLALEDNQERLQQRLYRMFGTDVAPALYFSNAAKPLGGGLDQQIETFRREHPDTNLVIIDTLQKVRESGNEKCSYASNYEIISKLKSLAEKL